MNRKYFTRTVAVLFFLLCNVCSFSQLKKIALLQNYREISADLKPFLKQGVVASFNNAAVEIIKNNPLDSLNFSFFFENKTLEITLTKNNIFSDHFFVTTGTKPNDHFLYNNTALHYKGIIKGDPHSFAAVSIVNNELVAVIADSLGNINIGAINTPLAKQQNEHIIYRDADLLLKNESVCATEDDGSANVSPIPSYSNLATSAATINTEPVDMYMEADYQTYLNNGSNVTNTVNYVTALFNVVKVMFENDSINTQINSIKIWNTADPYMVYSTSSQVLSLFSTNMANGFPGDLAHFLSQRSLGGGVAYLNTICSVNSNKVAVSGNLSNSFGLFPTYSWSVMVITHEIGHNLGSPHTQSCTWVGGAIDNCYATEGGCAQGPAPVNGGTVMSYCHLTGYGINLANGFGPKPIDKIKLILKNNPCLNPGIYFETTNQFVVEDSANVDNACLDYKLLTTRIKIPYAATQPANITLTASGSTGLEIGTNKDIEISPMSFTLDAANLSQLITFKVYNDAVIEAPELLVLNFNLNANSGNAIKKSNSFTHYVSITSNDYRPDSTVDVPLFYEPFDNIVSGLGSWTQTVVHGAASPNRWVIGNSGQADFSTKAAYISTNGDTLAYAGASLNDSTIVRLESPTINATGFSNINLKYSYKCNGQFVSAPGGQGSGGSVTILDFGNVYFSTDNGTTWTIAKENIFSRNQKTLENIILPAAADNSPTLKLAFEWRNNSSVVNNPPFIIDSIVLKGTSTSNIQTALHPANNVEEYLGPNQTVHFYNPTTKNIIATIENGSAFNFGCTRVELLRAGTGAAAAWGNLPSDKISDKVFKITTTNTNNAAPYKVKLYFTDAEINGWLAATGNSVSDINIVKTSGDLSLPTPATPPLFSSIHSVTNFGATMHSVVASEFTGFSTYAIMKPFGPAACPINIQGFKTDIAGTNYQWQVNDGTGYSNLLNDAVYNNVTTDSLRITAAPRSFYGQKYRCEINTALGAVYSPEYSLKAAMTWVGGISNAWEDPLNWSCNMVPDDKTDVTITGGTTFSPQLNASTTIKSLTAYTGTNILIKNGAVLSLVYQ